MNALPVGYTHRSAANSLLKSTSISDSFAGSDVQWHWAPEHPLTHSYSGSLHP